MTTGIEGVLRQLHHGEENLGKELLVIGERHRVNHEVAHVTTDLARWSYQNLQALSSLASSYGSFLEEIKDEREKGGPLTSMREMAANALGHRPGAALVLLRDLRGLYLMASGNNVNWIMLGQAAQACRDSQLLDVVTTCHPRTLRQLKWCNATIKALSPQTLSSP